ncbi:MAG: hypothetical protein LBK76_07515 [Verrucomicrobiales bacterium]|jgi:hypothetical protein|nr:hypothetical protein [Verrucomicrobiales bacterium]
MELSPWLLRLEQRFGHWGVPQLIKGMVLLNCLTLILQYLQPGFADMLSLNTAAISEHGEYWRLVTFLLQPIVSDGQLSWFWFIIAMWFLWFVGDGLERALGPLLLNLYLLLGVAALAVVALTLYPGAVIPNFYLLNSFLFAFAAFYSDLPIMLFFIIEVKIKYVAMFAAVVMLLGGVRSPALLPLMAASCAGYLVFFGPLYAQVLCQRASSRRRMKKFRGEE